MKNQSLAERLFKLLVINNEVYGMEDQNGWRTVKAKLTLKQVEEHLRGKYCLGVFPFNRKGYIKWFAVDVDYKGGDLEYMVLVKKFGYHSTLKIDTGGRGVHLFVFLQPTPLWQIAETLNKLERELRRTVFPKQREITPETIGNFIRMPLGRHFKTGNWSKIVKGDLMMVKPYITCPYRKFDQFGDGNCTYFNGTIGYCQKSLCPKIYLRKEVI